MRIVCARKSLIHALEIVGRATSRRSVKPILKSVKIVAADTGHYDSGLMLMATDLEFGIRRPFTTCQIVEPGAICVPAADLLKLLKNLTDEDVVLQTTETPQGLKILGAATENHLPTENADDFPDIPAFTAAEYHIVPVGKLRRMIELTSFAAAKESTKFAMTGTRLELNGKLVAVATDSKRLALMEGPCGKRGDPKDAEILVPTKALDLLTAATKGVWDGEMVRVAVGWSEVRDEEGKPVVPARMQTNEVIFEVDGTTIYTRLVGGRYPPYKEIFPKNTVCRIELPVGPLLANLQTVRASCDEEADRVKFDFLGDKLTLSASSTKGKSTASMPITYGGPALTINFTPGYVADVCKKFGKKDTLTFEMSESSRPAVFRAGVDYKYLVMPIS